jgi:thiosulfate reductase cytochrome b subunit
MIAPVHPTMVRITHWTNALGFFGLLISGVVILLAHPRLYWGETGAVGMPALIELPLPFVFGHSGWGRSLHFLSGWVCLFSGIAYTASALLTQHFHQGFRNYSRNRRVAYLGVIFLLFPAVLWTGLAMSPTVTSAVPAIVTSVGGQQTARTLHFAVAAALLAFAGGHVVLVWAQSRAVR